MGPTIFPRSLPVYRALAGDLNATADTGPQTRASIRGFKSTYSTVGSEDIGVILKKFLASLGGLREPKAAQHSMLHVTRLATLPVFLFCF